MNKSNMLPRFVIDPKTSHITLSNNNQRRFSRISNTFDNEYYNNKQEIEIINSELSQPLPNSDGIKNRRQFTQVISIVDNNEENPVKPKGKYLLLFILEPILTSCIIFPILVLFWDCGWNLVTTMLNSLNNYPLTYNLDGQNYTDDGYGDYSSQSLVISYIIVEMILLILYLCQDLFYNFFKEKHFLIRTIFIKFHILILTYLYIGQWEMIWLILDQYTPSDWTFMLVLSLSAVFLLIVITGTLSDLVCSPFVVSYDSIEYCIQFECSLLIENITQWKINLINFIFYEIIISNLTIIGWYGFYDILDNNLYPDDMGKSIWICLLIGYPIYFPLMYSQYYFEKLNCEWKFWKIFSLNFPQFHRNIFHTLSFASCIFLWRAYWELYDNYLRIYDEYYRTYLLVSFIIFGFLSLIQTFSSMNGPLKSMDDNYQFFPIYPHCYISKIVFYLSQSSFFQSKNKDQIKQIHPEEYFGNNNHK